MKKFVASAAALIAAFGLTACNDHTKTTLPTVTSSATSGPATSSAGATSDVSHPSTSGTVQHINNWSFTLPDGQVGDDPSASPSTTNSYSWGNAAGTQGVNFDLFNVADPNNSNTSHETFDDAVADNEKQFKLYGTLYSERDVTIPGADHAKLLTGAATESHTYLNIVVASKGEDLVLLSSESKNKSDLNSGFGMSVLTLQHS